MPRAACRLLARALQAEGGLRSAVGIAHTSPAAAADVPLIWVGSVERQLMAGVPPQRPRSALAAALEGAPPADATATAASSEQQGVAPLENVSAPAAAEAAVVPAVEKTKSEGLGKQCGSRRGMGDGTDAHAAGRSQRQSQRCRPHEPTDASTQRQPWQQMPWRLPPAKVQGRQQAQGQQQVQEGREAGAIPRWDWRPRNRQEDERRWQKQFIVGVLHQKETCREIVELLKLHAGKRVLTPPELTMSCSRMGRLYSGIYKVSGKLGGTADHNAGHCAEVFNMVVQRFGELDTQALATSVWMCARFHYLPPPEQCAAWEAQVWERREEISLIETANIFFSLGVLHWAPDVPLMDALLDQAMAQHASLTPWMVCNMMWGCARLTSFHPGPSRLMEMLEALLPKIDAFTPESYCSLLFSLACLRCRPDDVALTAVLDAMEWQVEKFSNRQLVTIVWALGALQLGDLVTEQLWNLIDATVQQQAANFNFSSAPLFLFGAARLQLLPSAELMQLLQSKAIEYTNDLRTGDVSVILWALAKMGHKSGDDIVKHEFVEAMVWRYMEHDRKSPATLRQTSAFLWALALLSHPPPPEVMARCIAAADRWAGAARSALTSTDASMLVSAFETFGSAEGLAVLKRHIIEAAGEAEEEAGADLDFADELRPTGLQT